MENLPELIRRLRREKGLTQVKFAIEARVSQQYVSRLEAGHIKIPRLHILERIARSLDCDVAQLAQAAGIKYTNTSEEPEDLLNKLSLALPVRLYIIDDIHTEGESRDCVWLPREVAVNNDIKAVRVKRNWIIQDPEIQSGDILVIDKSQHPPLQHKKRFPTAIFYNSENVIVKIYDGEEKGLAYYGRVVRIDRNIQ